MALTRAERGVVLRRVGTFLEAEFAPVLSHYYARAVAYSSKHPQNINNELRNALTHMSRAMCASDVQEANKEIAAAERHVERFKRDCLKVAVVYAGRNANELIRRAELAGKKLDPALSIATAAIVAKRYQILIEEVLGDAGAATKWEGLLLDIERVREVVLNAQPILATGRYKIALGIVRIWRFMKAAWVWVGLAILAAAIGAIAIPSGEKFGTKAQSLIVTSTAWLFRVPSSPPVPKKTNPLPSAPAKPGLEQSTRSAKPD